jgi:hypothetical protein
MQPQRRSGLDNGERCGVSVTAGGAVDRECDSDVVSVEPQSDRESALPSDFRKTIG